MRKIAGSARLATGLVLALCWSAGVTEDLRLAGTVSTGDGEWLALVEVPGTGQQLVRTGARVADGTVVAIGDRYVRVRHPAGERLYILESGRILAAWDVQHSASRAPGAPIVISRAAPHDLSQRLAQLLAVSANSPPGEFAGKFHSLLGLPRGTRVTAVDHVATATDAEAARRIRTGLLAGRPAHLFLDDGLAMDEVYLLPPAR